MKWGYFAAIGGIIAGLYLLTSEEDDLKFRGVTGRRKGTFRQIHEILEEYDKDEPLNLDKFVYLFAQKQGKEIKNYAFEHYRAYNNLENYIEHVGIRTESFPADMYLVDDFVAYIKPTENGGSASSNGKRRQITLTPIDCYDESSWPLEQLGITKEEARLMCEHQR